jgi:hypothetical protein
MRAGWAGIELVLNVTAGHLWSFTMPAISELGR